MGVFNQGGKDDSEWLVYLPDDFWLFVVVTVRSVGRSRGVGEKRLVVSRDGAPRSDLLCFILSVIVLFSAHVRESENTYSIIGINGRKRALEIRHALSINAAPVIH